MLVEVVPFDVEESFEVVALELMFYGFELSPVERELDEAESYAFELLIDNIENTSKANKLTLMWFEN